jgi:hypothetical protein
MRPRDFGRDDDSFGKLSLNKDNNKDDCNNKDDGVGGERELLRRVLGMVGFFGFV